ncbi:MAG: hypothetical protein E7634_07950 [Ruminococcaceae bacterium]|nr:hypothetical protein [Oscillospiraceae bacterium]
MKKIGFVDYYISEWHANNYPVWIDSLGCDYKVACAWAELEISPVDGLSTEQWCEKFDVKQCGTIDELCKECDVIVILAPSNPEKHLAYAEAVLKYGKPTYIDKTFAPDLDTAKRIFELAEKHGAPFFSTSALRFADELEALSGGDNFIITGGGSSFEEYCVHTIEMAVKLLGDKVAKTDVIRQGKQRICSMVTENGKKATIIYASNLGFSVTCDKAGGSAARVDVKSNFFLNLMKDIVRFFDSGVVSFDQNETLEVMRVRDAALNDAVIK